MPPKGRGSSARGRQRGRADSRGGMYKYTGGTASFLRTFHQQAAGEATETLDAKPATAAIADDLGLEAMTDSKPAISSASSPQPTTSIAAGDIQAEASTTPPTEDTQPEASTTTLTGHTQAEASTTNPAEPPARVPRKRLETLKSTTPASRSTSPAVRGRGATGRVKKAAPQPSFTGRRSKEERDARERAEWAREKERKAEHDAEKKRKERAEAYSKRGGASTRGRGGFSEAASGPFSMGSTRTLGKRVRSTRENSTADQGSLGRQSRPTVTGTRAVVVKQEKGESSGMRGGGGGGGGGGGDGGQSSSRPLKKEDPDQDSSDNEDPEFPRKDVDKIYISSDDEPSGPDQPGQPRRYRPTTATNLPVRIGRKEHPDRVLSLNTDASAEQAAKTLQKAPASGKSSSKGGKGGSRKGKSKAGDVEITGASKPFKGMWQDSSDSDVRVKTEGLSDDENLPDAEDISRVSLDPSSKAAGKQPTGSPEVEKKRRLRVKGHPSTHQVDAAEYPEKARLADDLLHLKIELGPKEEDKKVKDSSGDVEMQDAEIAAKKSKKERDGSAYMFQFPSKYPDFEFKKSEPLDATPANAQTSNVKPPKEKKQTIQEPLFSCFPRKERWINQAKPTSVHKPESQFVGKLIVHESGWTKLVWKKTPLEIVPAQPSTTLQDVFSAAYEPQAMREVVEEAGSVASVGRVRGKFIAVPDKDYMTRFQRGI